jgi:hypothetical protein
MTMPSLEGSLGSPEIESIVAELTQGLDVR